MDKIQVEFSTGDFFDEEINLVEDFLSDKYDVNVKYFARHSAEQLIPLLIIYISFKIADGFLSSVGQDIWKVVKSLPKSLKKNKKTNLSLNFPFEKKEIIATVTAHSLDDFKSALFSLSQIAELITEKNDENQIFSYNEKEEKWEEKTKQDY